MNPILKNAIPYLIMWKINIWNREPSEYAKFFRTGRKIQEPNFSGVKRNNRITVQ